MILDDDEEEELQYSMAIDEELPTNGPQSQKESDGYCVSCGSYLGKRDVSTPFYCHSEMCSLYRIYQEGVLTEEDFRLIDHRRNMSRQGMQPVAERNPALAGLFKVSF